MFNITKKSIEWAGATLELETGRVARQAGGAVMVTYGDTKLLCTATAAKKAKEGIDFFPLTCVYQEKAFAAGKIPGGFFKREARPSEHETLTSRLIDRPIRPLFDGAFKNETQVICTVLQYDGLHQGDVAAMIGASAALAISGLPFNGPIACARVGHVDGELVLNPETGFAEDSRLDLIVAGTKDSVMMVESEADELTEKEMLEAVVFAHEGMQPVIDLIADFAKEAGKPRWDVVTEDYSTLDTRISELTRDALAAAYKILDKQARVEAISTAKSNALTTLEKELGDSFDELKATSRFKNLEKDIVRGDLIENGTRIDGRAPDQVRDIVAEVGVLPGTHGSALFTRGETQALVVCTLGTGQDEQRIDSLDGDSTQHFMLHYNFPGYSVGEVSPLRSPGRREIGHGKLAWRALNALLPKKEDFPYTIRLVSEITESNGSSSMATVCGSALAMMDAGVPVKESCSGIAMGLVMEGDRFVVLSDIMGDEDHLGDMDFKVAGTENGITSLQMDIKIQGITPEIMKIALDQANGGRTYILEKMAEALQAPRGDVNNNAPKITSITIPTEKIREVIGAGGAVIRDIVETSGAKIDIDDDGTIKVAAVDTESANIALQMIKDITDEPEVKAIYEDCKVVSVVDFGCFVEFMGKRQGLVHISEIVDRRLESVSEEVKEGDLVKVKCIGIDRQGKVKLSMRAVDQSTGEDLAPDQEYPAEEARRGGGSRGGNRDRNDKRKAS